MLENIGGRTRARTWDPMIKSHLLYQLSYAPGTSPEIPSGRRRLAKRTSDVQQARLIIPVDLGRGKQRKKPPNSGGLALDRTSTSAQ